MNLLGIYRDRSLRFARLQCLRSPGTVKGLFLGATLLSSIGSLTFTICTVAFMLKAGYSLSTVGLTVGASRLFPLVANLVCGHLADHLPAKQLIYGSELLAGCCSLLILMSWNAGPTHFPLFLIATILRATVLAVQLGARTKISKLLSDASYQSNARQAIWLNKAMHGSTLFAAIIGWVAIKYLSLQVVIAFDAFTFLLGGLVLLLIELPATERLTTVSFKITQVMKSTLEKFKSLYQFSPRAAGLDLLLAVSMCGTVTLFGRLAGGHEEYIPLLLGSYGLAVWVAGYLERSLIVQKQHALIWLLLGGGYIAAFTYQGSFAVTWLFIFAKDIAYWLLFHRYSSHIQMQTPATDTAAVSSARVAQMTAVLALGEIGVGAWQSSVSLSAEGIWRGVFCFVVVALLATVWQSRGGGRDEASI